MRIESQLWRSLLTLQMVSMLAQGFTSPDFTAHRSKATTPPSPFLQSAVTSTSKVLRALPDDTSTSSAEVEELLARAKAIRDSLPKEESLLGNAMDDDAGNSSTAIESENKASSSINYRLYFDIGREDGTWMDPTWGRSGKRIEGSVDVSFQIPPINADDAGIPNVDPSLADESIVSKMVKDNLSGKSTAVRILEPSPNARLRGGFDTMKCYSGGYRLDIQKRASTARFFLDVEGTEGSDGNYGDIFIPKGCLYFSLPCFNNNVRQLSSKEGIVTVRQMGWHTGWRREESRIVGVFRAVPLEQAKKKDKF